MVGTPVKAVTRSASIRRSASSAFHLYMSTIFRPGRKLVRKIAWQPVTWNSGTVNNMAPCASGSAGTSSGWRSAMIATDDSKHMIAEQIARWVEMAPFGKPVVPDVYMMVASSSG